MSVVMWFLIASFLTDEQTALFASWFSFGLPGAFWLYLNRGLWFSSPKKIFLTFVNMLCIAIGIILVSI